MKTFNLIKRLWTDSHEKQSPQRFARYAAILVMLLTLGVGQMWADYYYRGGKNSWGATAMTVHSSGLYEYYSTSAANFNGDRFKISKTTSGYDYNQAYVAKGFNGGVNDIGDYGGDDCYIWSSSNGYIIVYYPNTIINTTSSPKITFRTSLYSPTFYIKHPWGGGSWTWQTMSNNSTTKKYTYTGVYSSGSGANVYTSKSDNNYLTPSGTSDVNNNVPAIWTYNAKDNTLSIAPAYTLTVTNDGHGSASGSVSKGIKMSTKYAISASSPSTGYHFNNWTRVSGGTCTFDNASSASTNVTVTGDASATVRANFALNTYTVAYNANDAQYPGTATGSTSSTSHTYGTAKALTSNGFSRAGYTFAGWATTPTGSVAYTNGQSVTNLTSTHGATVTLYAKWTENLSTVSFVASPTGKGTFKVGGSTVTSTTAGVTTTRSVTAYPISGYRFTGWSISGGASISSTSDNPTTVTGGGAGTAATLTATFEENLVYYDVTFGVGTSYTSLGSLSATNNTTSSAISSGDDILSASSITFTATPNTGYVVEGWYTNAACTTGKHDAGSTTYTIASLSGAVTVYVKFVEKTWSVAFAAGTGGSVTTPAATPQTVGQITGISIAATPSTGYTFNRWTISSGSGSFTSAVTTNSNKFKPTAASTITASFSETMSTLSTSCHYDVGNPSYAAPTVAGSATTVGYGTTRSITAAAAGTGYRFVGWTLTNCTRTDGGGATANPITIRSNGDGAAATVVANYEEVLTQSTWIVAGGNKIVTSGTTWRTTADANNSMVKKTGHSTESVVYFTVPVTTVCSGDPNTNFQFKIYNTSTSKWYGLFASGSYYLLKAEDGTEKSLVLDNQNIELRAYVTGNYEFKLDYSTSTPKLTVTWPVINQVRISAASPTDATNTGNFDLSDPVSNVRSVKRSLNANTTYTFKIVYNSDFYGYNSGTFTRSTSTSSNSRTISTSGGDMTLTTDYAGDYTFKFNQSTKALSVDFPTAYKITFGKGSVDGTTGSFSAVDLDNGSSAVTSNSTWVKSGNRVKVTAPDAKTGYRFLGWYDNNSATGAAITTLANCTITVNTTKTVYACYAPKQSALTFDYQTTATGYGSSGSISAVSATYDAAMPSLTGSMPSAATGYAFMGFYDGMNGEGTKYYNADGSSAHTWDKDKTTGTTLYAYYKKAEITNLAISAAAVNPGQTGVTVTPTISPTPTPTTTLCFSVVHSNGNPLATPVTVTWNGTNATFTAPTGAGSYKVTCSLRTGSGACPYYGGTLLDSTTVNFQVAGDHTVTVQYKCGEETIQASSSLGGIKALTWSSDITAPTIFGYTFSEWTAGDGVTIKDAAGEDKTSSTYATIKIKAIYDGYLIANYTQNAIIYFKNTLGWEDVYVNFYTASDWDSSDNGSGSQKGAGNNGVTNRNKHMTQIGSTDVWYYDYGYNGGGSSITPSLYVSFTSASQNNVNEFWAANPGIGVVYPANYPDAISTDKSSENGFKAATPMFVPLATQDAVAINVGGGGRANYYNAGYWTKYTPGTGYTLEIYNSAGSVLLKSVEFTSEDDLMPMKAVVDLEAGQTYKYQLRRGGTDSYGIYYGNSGTMTYANHGQNPAWAMTNSSFSMCGITTNAAGDYTFNLSYSAYNNAYRLRMAVDYPVALGDFRLVYSDNDTWSRGVAHTLGTWKMTSHPIIHRANGVDTVSFFISKTHSPEIRWEKATAVAGTITYGTTGSWLTTGYTNVSESGVYNFKVTQNADGSGISSIERIGKYTGNYYIRTDVANSKWDNYSSDADHLMTYSEYSIDHGGYSHYYCHWVNKDDASRKNVKFCIANDYSPCISDTLTREVASGTWANISNYIDASGNILRNANVRYMWNQSTNVISRAYIDGAQEKGSYFLEILSADHKIHDPVDDTELTQISFEDKENWVYEQNIKAKPGAQIKLQSNWGETNKIVQYFKGSPSTTEQLIGGSSSDWYDIRVIYDFKTNRLIASWVPSDATIESNNEINADIMFIREHQGDIAQLTFGESGKISEIKTAYGVLRLSKWTLNNLSKTLPHSPLGSPASIYERSLYWISFPFRVKLSEVIGFGTYGEHWAIQRYDGAARAQKGHFQENGSFWRWMNRNTEYLEPNQGYLLAVDLDLLGRYSDVWGPTDGGGLERRSDRLEIYFPSYGTMPDITNANVVQTIPSHECTINWYEEGKVPGPDTGDPRTSYNRTVFDSHWNIISVPTYVNTNDVSFANTTWISSVGPKFLYTWNPDDNTITATSASGYTYHAMHAYMVQYGGTVTWSASSGSPASIVARRTYAEQLREVEFRLELQQDSVMIDRTFVALSDDEETSAGFRFGEDLTKEFNNKSSIYTSIPGEALVAGNTLPMSDQTTIVPVGVDIKTNGDYTFAIPDGTSGVGVTLVDTETGIRTSLSALSYTVNLTAGTHDGRFLLEIAPIQQTPTDIDLINGENGENGVRKMLINQQMYIIRDGKIYDARGARVQ